MKKVLPPTYFFLALVLIVALHLAFPIFRYATFPFNL